jgi:hypothetical protein
VIPARSQQRPDHALSSPTACLSSASRAPAATHATNRPPHDNSRIEGLVGQSHFGKRRPSSEDHEEQQPGLAWLDATLASRCRGASYPRSKPGFSRRRRPALKPLFSRVVRSVAWNAVRGYGYRCRAARLSVPERLPGRKWTWTSSPQSVGGPWAGETGGGAAVRGAKPSWPSPACEPPVRRGPAPAGSRLVTGPGLGVTRSAGYRRRTPGTRAETPPPPEP